MILDGNDPSAIATAARPCAAGAAGPAHRNRVRPGRRCQQRRCRGADFCIRGRPSDHPLIVHVADAAGIAHFAADVPAFAQNWSMPSAGPARSPSSCRACLAWPPAPRGGARQRGPALPGAPVAQALLAACAAPRDALCPDARGGCPSANLLCRVSSHPPPSM